MKSIIQLYYGFRGYLKKKINSKRIAALQIRGKIEQYLVDEFIYYVFSKTEGKLFAISNAGNKGERKYDIAILDGIINDTRDLKDLNIIGLIEAKYINNCHRFMASNYARDNINVILKNLNNQLGIFKGNKHAGFNVKLKSKHVYGLVFASFVSDKKNDRGKDFKKKYYESIKDLSSAFKYHDFENAHFNRVYEDVEVKILNKTFFVTLRMGLWTLKM